MTDRYTRELYNTLAAEGIEIVEEKKNGSNHFRFVVRQGDVEVLLIAPRKFACPHSKKNFLTQLRRMIQAKRQQLLTAK